MPERRTAVSNMNADAVFASQTPNSETVEALRQANDRVNLNEYGSLEEFKAMFATAADPGPDSWGPGGWV